ncbi:sialate O-acetylesterase [Seonamhaeicola sp. NFXS20]|uniref:sialate O-acetylesterase n=1 Tax=Seonamhaeicola sp. NFXS20 TaxID=2816959 RepID=UPI003BA177B2
MYLRILLVFFVNAICFSQVRLPAFFSDNMVLQQNDSVAIWGVDKPNTPISIEVGWGEKSLTKSDENGHWKFKIKTPKASYNSYDLIIKGSSTTKINNVLIGEVWFASGQSNMEMPIKGFSNSPVSGYNEFILNSKNQNIRLFRVRRSASVTPEKDVVGEWEQANPNTIDNFSAIGYLFAKKLQKTLKIPIGIISSCWGGTGIKAWSPKEALKGFSFIKFPKKLPSRDNEKRGTPTLLYNAMIHPFLGYNIKGFLWYQGESDRFHADKYKLLFPNMVKFWRKKWSLKTEIPFYYVQIAPYDYSARDRTKKPNGALLREAQLLSLSKINNSEMVVTADVGDCNDIHPSRKEQIANRLAYIALNKDYNFKTIKYKSPIYKSMEIKGDSIELFFDSITSSKGNGFNSYGKQLKGFYIAGEDKVFYPAKVIITKERTLKVFSEKVKSPKAVRYGFENCFEVTLFNAYGLPASPFRTDQWEVSY